MPRILTVDDSRAIWSIVTKQVLELGFEVEEAEHGEDGLTKLEECEFDLVLLDVTMPVLDGPGMLAKMRERGVKTPVLMLTSESKRSVVSGVMKLGIEDYILKPFKPEELRAKVLKALKVEAGQVSAAPAGGGGAPPPAPVAHQQAAPAAGAAAASAGRPFVDVLIVDDMENVHKKFRSVVPAHVSMNGVASAQAALTIARDKVFRVILVDTEMPDVSSAALVGQLRALQPHATFLGLCLRSTGDAEAEARGAGFDGVLFKPFDQTSIEDFLILHFDNQDLLHTEDNLARVSAFTGKEDRLERYLKRLEDLMDPFLVKAAAACFDAVVLDVGQIPVRPDRTPRMLLNIQKHARKLGLEVRLVGTPELGTVLRGIAETAAIPFFPTAAEARAAA